MSRKEQETTAGLDPDARGPQVKPQDPKVNTQVTIEGLYEKAIVEVLPQLQKPLNCLPDVDLSNPKDIIVGATSELVEAMIYRIIQESASEVKQGVLPDAFKGFAKEFSGLLVNQEKLTSFGDKFKLAIESLERKGDKQSLAKAQAIKAQFSLVDRQSRQLCEDALAQVKLRSEIYLSHGEIPKATSELIASLNNEEKIPCQIIAEVLRSSLSEALGIGNGCNPIARAACAELISSLAKEGGADFKELLTTSSSEVTTLGKYLGLMATELSAEEIKKQEYKPKDPSKPVTVLERDVDQESQSIFASDRQSQLALDVALFAYSVNKIECPDDEKMLSGVLQLIAEDLRENVTNKGYDFQKTTQEKVNYSLYVATKGKAADRPSSNVAVTSASNLVESLGKVPASQQAAGG